MQSLVTGGAGFLGSHVADELIRRGHEVTVIDDLSGGFEENVPRDAEFIAMSITDPTAVKRLFDARRFDYVFHLAAYAAEGLSHFIKRFNYTNNLLGSVNLINAAVNAGTVKCFVFTSSIAVYGKNQVPMTEEMTPSPEDPYGIAKFAVELDLRESHEMFGLPFIVFRPHNVYGERQNLGDRYRNVVGIFINQAMTGEPFTVFGDGSQTRAFSYISDVAPVIAHSIDEPRAYNQIFNVGGDVPCSVNDLATVVAAEMGVPLRLNRLDARREVMHAYSSHDKVRALFGDVIKNVSTESGVARMCDWAKRHGPMPLTTWDTVEVRRNLPSSWASVLAASSQRTGPREFALLQEEEVFPS